MGFTSLTFFCFFPIAYLVYLLVPSKARRVWLLIVSYIFCGSFGVRYALVLFLSSIATWLAGIFIEKYQGKAEGKWIVEVVIL